MKPINNEAFKNICEEFSCGCGHFCSEATYITMEEIAHDCDPFTYEEEEDENCSQEEATKECPNGDDEEESCCEEEITNQSSKKEEEVL